MTTTAQAETRSRRITHRTAGRAHGPIVRLVSPGDLGELIKPFVFLDRFEMAAGGGGGGFGWHPHSGIATVTVFLEGGSTYEDSTGASGVLKPGSVEWMQAGGGVWHTGAPLPGLAMRGFQLWLALPEAIENASPHSLYVAPDDIPQAGPARVILGRYQGLDSPIPPVSPLTYLHVRLKEGEHWTFERPAGHDVAWVAPSRGELLAAGQRIGAEVAVFDGSGEAITFEALGETEFVLGSAARHPHPLVTGYYSVHTSPQALATGEAGIQALGQRMREEGKI